MFKKHQITHTKIHVRFPEIGGLGYVFVYNSSPKLTQIVHQNFKKKGIMI